MGQCKINFDSIRINNKKSDSDHSDNDWLSIVWYADNSEVRRDTVPLRNLNGSQVLETGDVIGSCEMSGFCRDNNYVLAVYAINNLGSCDWDQQAEAAAKITGEIAQACSRVYMEAAKLTLEALSFAGVETWPVMIIAQYLQDHWDLFTAKVEEVIGEIFDKVIKPLVGGIVAEISNILGHPDCNGEVMQDYLTFWPGVHNDASYTKTYEGPQKNSYCGSPPHTQIDITTYRELDQYVGEFGPVIEPDFNQQAIAEFQQRARVAVQEGYIGGFPNFYYASHGPRNVGQTIFLKKRCAELHNVDELLLRDPDQANFGAMMRAANDYAVNHGYSGGFPTFLSDQHISFSRLENMSAIGTAANTPEVDRMTPLKTPRLSPWSNTNARLQTDLRIVCGIVLISKGCAEYRELPIVLLGNPPLNDIGARFRGTQDYAIRNEFVGGFPTFYQKGSGLTTVCGTVLITGAAAVRREVTLYWGPN